MRSTAGHALRRLTQSPGFSAVAVLTLALGIGGATAIFSVADAVVLRPLPYRDPDRLVVVWQAERDRNQSFIEVSYPAFLAWRDRSRMFESLAAMSSVNDEVILTGRGEPAPVEGRWVTSEFFSVLGVSPALGRPFRSEDDKVGAADVVVISHQFWRDRLSGTPDVIGESVTLDGKPRTVVGVMPAGFAYPKGAQYWTPLGPAAGPAVMENRNLFWMILLGRVAENGSVAAAQSELTGIFRQAHRAYFNPDGYSAVLTSLADTIFGPTRAALFGLLGAVVLVLMMACVNVAGLLLVRAASRNSDLAIRQALGATRKQLAVEALAETLLLALAGGIGGLVIAIAVTPLIVAMSPPDVPRLEAVAVNTRAYCFAAGLSLLAAVASALAPISLTRRTSVAELPRRTTNRVIPGRTRVGAVLVVAEIAIAVIVLVAAGLVGRSFVKLRDVPLGFQPDRLLTVRITPKGGRYDDIVRTRALYEELLQRVRSEPGVRSAGAISIRPLWSTVGFDTPYTVEGQSPQEARRNPLLNQMAVSADYFTTMGIAVRQGRVFSDRDTSGQPGVLVVGESLASRVWPGENPIGKRLMIPMPGSGYEKQWLTVIGVVADARYRELQATRLDLYMSHLQADIRLGYLTLRTMGDPSAVAPAVRAIVRDLDSDVPVTEIQSMDQIVSDALGNPRFSAVVFGVFGFMALALAALGVYGMLAYAVTQRTPEIGVRRALGARMPDILRSVLGNTVRLALTGTAIGLLLASMLVRTLETLLFEVEPADPLTFAIAPFVLLLAAFVACLVPAWRAIRVDPLIAIRSE